MKGREAQDVQAQDLSLLRDHRDGPQRRDAPPGAERPGGDAGFIGPNKTAVPLKENEVRRVLGQMRADQVEARAGRGSSVGGDHVRRGRSIQRFQRAWWTRCNNEARQDQGDGEHLRAPTHRRSSISCRCSRSSVAQTGGGADRACSSARRIRMAKPIQAVVKLQCTRAAPRLHLLVGPALGQHGINIVEFCKQFKRQDAAPGGTCDSES